MKKKFLSLILAVVTAFSVMSFSVSADEIKVKLAGQRIDFDVAPQIINDRTMVPLRAIFEALGATVDWDAGTRTVTSRRFGIIVEATIGSNTMYINGQGFYIDTAPTIVNDRTLVPVRFIAESFGLQVDWDGASQTVNIADNITDNITNNVTNFIEKTPKPTVKPTEKPEPTKTPKATRKPEPTEEPEYNSSDETGTYADPIILYDGDKKSGYINKDNSENWYKINIKDDGVLEVGCVPDNPGVYVVLKLYGENNSSSLGYRNDADKRLLISKAIEPGTYYIQVTTELYGRETDYELDCTFTKQPLQNDPVGKGTYQKANPIEKGETLEGHIGYTSDAGERDLVDWYTFTLDEDEEIEVSFVGDPDLWVYLYLMDKNGDKSLGSTYGRDQKLSVKKTLEAGTYYIKIDLGSSNFSYGGYQLSLE